jgi:hypothetical protein
MTLPRTFLLIALCLSTGGIGAGTLAAADAKVESALGQFGTIAGDEAKLAAWCKMSKSMAAADGVEPSTAQQEAIDNDLKDALAVLGVGFQDSWMLLGSLDPDTADGRAYGKVIEDLEKKCGK